MGRRGSREADDDYCESSLMAMHLLQRKQAQYAIGFAVCLSIVAVAVLVTWAPQSLILMADIVVLVALVILCEGGGSIYKLVLWFRYRKDPDRRELIASSSQVYPKRLRNFLMDEPDEQESRTHDEETPPRRRKTDSRRETGRSC